MQTKEKNLIVELSLCFALKIMKYTSDLEKNNKSTIARQLLRSGTGIGANVREAQNAESKTDFIHNMKIAAKEADESVYWLSLCKESEDYPDPGELLEEAGSVVRVLSKFIATSKNNSTKKKR